MNKSHAEDFKGNDGGTEFIRTLDGRIAQEHHYDEMTDEECYTSIDDRSNILQAENVGGSVGGGEGA